MRCMSTKAPRKLSNFELLQKQQHNAMHRAQQGQTHATPTSSDWHPTSTAPKAQYPHSSPCQQAYHRSYLHRHPEHQPYPFTCFESPSWHDQHPAAQDQLSKHSTTATYMRCVHTAEVTMKNLFVNCWLLLCGYCWLLVAPQRGVCISSCPAHGNHRVPQTTQTHTAQQLLQHHGCSCHHSTATQTLAPWRAACC
jgi:hypothetical protein